MQERFDRALFATILVALALLISVSSAARFPGMLRPAKQTVGLGSVSSSGLSSHYTVLR